MLGVLSIKEASQLIYVSKAALSFIATSAGAELLWHEIAPLIRTISYISVCATILTVFGGALVAFGARNSLLLSWLGNSSLFDIYNLYISSDCRRI